MRRVFLVMMLGCGTEKQDAAQTDSSLDSGAPEVPDSDSEDSGGGDTATSEEDTGPGLRPCGQAAGTLPDGLTTLIWDDGEGYISLPELGWVYADQPLATSRVFEAVRFDLDRPARIYGFTVEFGALPEGDETPVTAGIFSDFGHNGFDFWHADPLWTASLCAGDLTVDGLGTYVLDAPVEITQPGLVYVAHERGSGDAAWNMDISVAGDSDCATFSDCHSAVNLPDVGEFAGTSYWNGFTFPLRYDYVVRLHLEYTDEIAPTDKRFQLDEAVTLGSRMSWGDFDLDGDADLFVSGPRLLRNDGGVFIDVTDSSGLGAAAGSGGVWGDFNNDGCLDLFSFVESGTADDTLMQGQCDGTFVDVTAVMGITDVQGYNDCVGAGWTRSPTSAAAWVDIDGDGFLDLYISNFNCWTDYSHFTDRVWRNIDGTGFEEWTGLNGFYGDEDWQSASRGVSPIDHDQDGDVDLWVNNYVLERNLFYDNAGDGTFTESARTLGLAGHAYEVGWSAYYGHTIGTAWGDLDNDGDFDAIAANLAHPRFWNFSDKTEVRIQDEYGVFSDIQGDWETPVGDAGLRYQETHSVPVLADFDGNGALDLVITAVYDGRPTDFYWGDGDGHFTLDVHTTGIGLTNGWGVAVGDADNDGDVDLASSGGLYLNTGETGHSLQFRVIGNVWSNHAAIGATLRAYVGDTVFLRHVSGGNGQGGQDSQILHIGLGDTVEVDRVEVDFPGGGTVEFTGPFAADQHLWLFEDGTATAGWAYPGSD